MRGFRRFTDVRAVGGPTGGAGNPPTASAGPPRDLRECLSAYFKRRDEGTACRSDLVRRLSVRRKTHHLSAKNGFWFAGDPLDRGTSVRKTVLAGAVALAATAVTAALAEGQDGGAPELGTLTYDVVTRFSREPSPTSNPGVNPARPRDPDRQNPADLLALNARIVMGGKVVGRSHIVITHTYLGRGRQQRGGAAIEHVVEDFGGGNTLSYQGVVKNSPRPDVLSVVGGTGRYAGADGTVKIEEISFDERRRIARERLTVTFTP